MRKGCGISPRKGDGIVLRLLKFCMVIVCISILTTFALGFAEVFWPENVTPKLVIAFFVGMYWQWYTSSPEEG